MMVITIDHSFSMVNQETHIRHNLKHVEKAPMIQRSCLFDASMRIVEITD